MTRFKHLTYQDLVKYQKIQLTYEKLISFSASKRSEKREVGEIRGMGNIITASLSPQKYMSNAPEIRGQIFRTVREKETEKLPWFCQHVNLVC